MRKYEIQCTVEGCEQDARVRQMCRVHYKRVLRTGTPAATQIVGDDVTRFWSKVEFDGCWLWMGHRSKAGYGVLHIGGRAGAMTYAHRWAYEFCVGPIPPGLDLDHLCRVRHCVNPTHLEPVPHRINILRGEGPTAVNAIKSHCKNGHPFTADNVYKDASRPTGRRCRICTLARQKAER